MHAFVGGAVLDGDVLCMVGRCRNVAALWSNIKKMHPYRPPAIKEAYLHSKRDTRRTNRKKYAPPPKKKEKEKEELKGVAIPQTRASALGCLPRCHRATTT